MDKKKRVKDIFFKSLLLNILSRVQNREIGLEVGKNQILSLIESENNDECEDHEWVAKIKFIKN